MLLYYKQSKWDWQGGKHGQKIQVSYDNMQRDLHSSGTVDSTGWKFHTDIMGQPTVPLSRVGQFLDCMTHD